MDRRRNSLGSASESDESDDSDGNADDDDEDDYGFESKKEVFKPRKI